MNSDESQIDMQYDTPEETGNVFSRHGAPLQPLTEETAIRTAAEHVVSSVPLLDESQQQHATKISSAVYGASGVQQSDINTMTAEDVRDNDF